MHRPWCVGGAGWKSQQAYFGGVPGALGVVTWMGKPRLLWALAAAVVVARAHARVMWSGAITNQSVVLAVERLPDDPAGSLVVSLSRTLDPPVQSNASFGTTMGVMKWQVEALTPETQYYYGVPGV